MFQKYSYVIKNYKQLKFNKSIYAIIVIHFSIIVSDRCYGNIVKQRQITEFAFNRPANSEAFLCQKNSVQMLDKRWEGSK